MEEFFGVYFLKNKCFVKNTLTFFFIFIKICEGKCVREAAQY